MRELYDYQQETLDFVKGRNGAGFLFEMRLGKTLTTIRWVKSLKVKRVMVVAPLTVFEPWQNELADEGLPPATELLRGTQRLNRIFEEEREQPNKPGWYLINYQNIKHFVEFNPKKNRVRSVDEEIADVLILDESTAIRQPKPQTTKALLAIARSHAVRYRCILSGLPNPEDLLDYFTQMQFVLGGGNFMGCSNWWQFRERYFMPDRMGWTWYPKPGAKDKIVKNVKVWCVLKTRKEVGRDNEKVYQSRHVTLPSKLRKIVDTIDTKWEWTDEEGTRHLANNPLQTQAWEARITGGFLPDGTFISNYKIKALMELLEGELQQEQVIVWFRFNSEIREVSQALEKAKINHSFLTGKDSSEDRKATIRKFRRGDFRVILMQVKIGKYGLNMSHCDTAIYYSNSLEAEDRYQSEERIVHPEKKSPLLIIDLVARGTVDEHFKKLLVDKRINAKQGQRRVNLKRELSKLRKVINAH